MRVSPVSVRRTGSKKILRRRVSSALLVASMVDVSRLESTGWLVRKSSGLSVPTLGFVSCTANRIRPMTDLRWVTRPAPAGDAAGRDVGGTVPLPVHRDSGPDRTRSSRFPGKAPAERATSVADGSLVRRRPVVPEFGNGVERRLGNGCQAAEQVALLARQDPYLAEVVRVGQKAGG